MLCSIFSMNFIFVFQTYVEMDRKPTLKLEEDWNHLNANRVYPEVHRDLCRVEVIVEYHTAPPLALGMVT